MADRIHGILAARGLTVLDVSKESRRRYPDTPAYWIPHHFYADLGANSFGPRIEQVLAFSSITGYRLIDWLGVFDIHLDEAPPLAASLPADRTILLDTEIYDENVFIEWFRPKPLPGPPPAIAPLSQLLESGPRQPLRSLLPERPSPFLYAKIGRQDAFSFPDLLPGSIVRIDMRRGTKSNVASFDSRNLFIIEHSQGFVCCRLHSSRKNFVTLRSVELPFAEIELQIGKEARILGTLDWEFRFLDGTPKPDVPNDLANFWTPKPLSPVTRNLELHRLLRQARVRAGLSLREASARSERIVSTLGDKRYFCTRGTLAAYERERIPPHHVHKIFALCVLYSLTFWDVVAAAGLNAAEAGQQPLPTDSITDRSSIRSSNKAIPDIDQVRNGFVSQMEEFEEIPFFLRSALGRLTSLPRISLRDWIWFGAQGRSLHPYLRTAVFGIVHHQSKKPAFASEKSLWQQPLYLILLRDGSYLCARCSVQKDWLIVHPFADGSDRPVRLRNGDDAEILGKVTALLRKL